MQKTFIMAGTLVVALGVTVSSVFAFGPRHEGRGFDISFEDLDTDSNGQITKLEMQAIGTARFDEADSDGNGSLSAEELQARAQHQFSKRITRMIRRFDEDGDGALSRDEMPKPRRAERLFDRFDEDGSGGISKDEFDEVRAEFGQHRKGRWGKHGPKD